MEASWPLGLDDRGVLAQFMALHIVRTPAFLEWFVPTRENSLNTFRDWFSSQEQWEQFCAVMRSDKERAKKILTTINKLATLIGGMHWTLLTFDEPLLITSDQPVAPGSGTPNATPRGHQTAPIAVN